MKVIDLLKILLTQVDDIPKYIYFEDYKYEYDSKENDYFCEQLNYFLFMNVLGENLESNLDLPITIIEEDKEIEHINIRYWSDEEYTPEQRINVCMTTIDELIDIVNELKKGKKNERI